MESSYLITQRALTALRTELETIQQNLLSAQEDIARIQTYAETRLTEIENDLIARFNAVQAALIQQIIDATLAIIAAIPTPDAVAPPLGLGAIVKYEGSIPDSNFGSDGKGIVGTAWEGWAVCDSRNGTPDYRNRFPVAAGETYAPGDTGGLDEVTLSPANLKHRHGIGRFKGNSGNNTDDLGVLTETDVTQIQPSMGVGGSRVTYGEINGALPGDSSFATMAGVFARSGDPYQDAAATATAHENRPPFRAAYFVIKLSFVAGQSEGSGSGGSGGGSGGSTTITIIQAPIGCMMDYYGSASNFNGTGLGIGPLEGWALCNGNNGTPDWRDRITVSARQNSTFESQPRWVSNVEGSLKVDGGSPTHTLTIPEMPKHSHKYDTMGLFSVQDEDGHLFGPSLIPNNVEGHFVQNEDGYTFTETGGDQPFSIMPPYKVAAKIMRIS